MDHDGCPYIYMQCIHTYIYIYLCVCVCVSMHRYAESVINRPSSQITGMMQNSQTVGVWRSAERAHHMNRFSGHKEPEATARSGNGQNSGSSCMACPHHIAASLLTHKTWVAILTLHDPANIRVSQKGPPEALLLGLLVLEGGWGDISTTADCITILMRIHSPDLA